MNLSSQKLILPFLKFQDRYLVRSSYLQFYNVNFASISLKHQVYRAYATDGKKDELAVKVESPSFEVSTTLHKVKETTKTASYMGVIVVGVGLTGILFYTIFNELFSSNSSNSIYTKTLKKCCNEPKVINKIGDNIKGYGEETRRGRRQHVSHVFFERDGIEHLRMKFYIQGSRKKATVHLEMKKDDSGKFAYRYLFVQLDDYPHEVIVLEDNRTPNLVPNTSPTLDFDLSKY